MILRVEGKMSGGSGCGNPAQLQPAPGMRLLAGCGANPRSYRSWSRSQNRCQNSLSKHFLLCRCVTDYPTKTKQNAGQGNALCVCVRAKSLGKQSFSVDANKIYFLYYIYNSVYLRLSVLSLKATNLPVWCNRKMRKPSC